MFFFICVYVFIYYFFKRDSNAERSDLEEPEAKSGHLNSSASARKKSRSSSSSSSSGSDSSSEDTHDDFCIICGDSGKLVLCDFCPRVYHLGCVLLKHVPKGQYR